MTKIKTIIFSLLTMTLPSFAYEVKSNSPEGWAMAYTTSSSLNLGLIPPKSSVYGDINISAELSSIPKLSAAQQKIGFSGTKNEDLNKSPVFGRLRLGMGMGWNTTAELSWTPPFKINGAKPKNLWGLSISRSFMVNDEWHAGLRIFALQGSVFADVTCSKDRASIEPLTDGNSVGCTGISNDKLTMDHRGIETSLSFNELRSGLKPWISLALSDIDPSVQVDAPLINGRELAFLRTQNKVQTYSMGVNFDYDKEYMLTLSGSYTPLSVDRPIKLDSNEDYWTIRIGITRNFSR